MGGVDLSQKDAQLAEEVRQGQEDSETNPLTAATARVRLAKARSSQEKSIPPSSACLSQEVIAFTYSTSPLPQETLKPDTANNNTFDMPSAVFLYTRLQVAVLLCSGGCS